MRSKDSILLSIQFSKNRLEAGCLAYGRDSGFYPVRAGTRANLPWS